MQEFPVRNGTSSAHVQHRGCPSEDLVRWQTGGLVYGSWAPGDGVCPDSEESPKIPTDKRNDELGKLCAKSRGRIWCDGHSFVDDECFCAGTRDCTDMQVGAALE